MAVRSREKGIPGHRGGKWGEIHKDDLIMTDPAGTDSGPDAHDDDNMVLWGWVILFLTWLLFVVVIGSCFGVWSWVWDVYEIEPAGPGPAEGTSLPGSSADEGRSGKGPGFWKDPTLPIDGYYPALLVLAVLMSWVWVVFAWLGMKYFRHAKVG